MPKRAQLTGPYLPIELPDRFELQFLTDRGQWIGEALCWRRDFNRLDDNSWIYSGGASALWIRYVAHHGDHFEHVDGGGNLHRYRLVERD